MGSSCCAVGCQNRTPKRKDLAYYRIPKLKIRRQKWLAAIKREDWSEEKIENARLCSEHFITDKILL